MPFFIPVSPMFKVISIYIFAAIIPAVILMVYIYKRDTAERKSAKLLISLILCGICAALCSLLPEKFGNMILNRSIPQNSPYYTVIYAFLVVALVEEGTKLLLMKYRTWDDWNFTHSYDGIVYSAFVSLGFSAFENINYVFTYGLSVAFSRAIFAIPGHLCFSVFMGICYSRAKQCENRRRKFAKVLYMLAGYLFAVLLHGFYDFCAMTETAVADIVFYIFVAIMYVVVYFIITRVSRRNHTLY